MYYVYLEIFSVAQKRVAILHQRHDLGNVDHRIPLEIS